MNDTLYLKHSGLAAAESQIIDSCLGIANEGDLHARIQRLPSSEPNTVKLTVQLFPPLLDTFERVAWRRTYRWGARHWRLPAELIGTTFTYQRDEYEFAGACLKVTIPGHFFIAIRKSDGWRMHMAESFLRQSVLPAMQEDLGPIGIFSIGLGEKERFFL
jgi:hypothetical protein